MGTHHSHHQQQVRKSSIIHSGKSYVSNHKQSLPPSHHRFSSADFDKTNLELKENLPDNLKAYSNSIEILYGFWSSEIDTLSETAYKETALLLYANIFKVMPEARLLIKKDLELQAMQYFGMFRWIITNLRQPDSGRLMKRIKLLGELHTKLNIQPEWYEVVLQALHETLADRVKDKYTARIRFCMEQLYTVVANIMLGRDFESLSSEKIYNLLKSLNRLEDCLEDTEASTYLELYMKQQFCVELILFYKDSRDFRESSLSAQQRIGRDIMRKYLDDDGECEINVSYDAKKAVYTSLKENHHVFALEIFDECCAECVELIRMNVWLAFKRSITKMATVEDIYYDQIQTMKARGNSTPTDTSHHSHAYVEQTETPTSISHSNFSMFAATKQAQTADPQVSSAISPKQTTIAHVQAQQSTEHLLPRSIGTSSLNPTVESHQQTPSLNESTTSTCDLKSLLVID